MMSLSGAELGTLTEGEGSFRPCQALQNYDSAGSSARVKQIVMPAPDPIRREPRAPFIIVQADQVQGALKSQLQRHGSCLHRLGKGAKISFRKGWWQTGEQTKIKAQQSHEIWVSKSLENERATFQASDIESNLRWTHDQINASPCLQRYLDALPSGEYFGKGYQVVATDGSLRLNRSSTKEPAMGAGVMLHDRRCHTPQIRTGGLPTLQHAGRTSSCGHGITRNPSS